MARVALPREPDRAWLFAHGCAMSIVLIAVGAGAAAMFDVVWPVIVGALVALPLALTGWRDPWKLEVVYRAWNKLARIYASAATTVVSATLYFLVLPVTGLAGSALRRRAPAQGESAWHERGTLSDRLFAGTGVTRDGRSAGDLPAWTTAGRIWVVTLLPYLAVLRALGSSEESTVSSSSYTLY